MTGLRDTFETPSATAEERIRVRILLLNGNELKGYIYLEGTDFERRVSTLFNDARAFVPLTDVELYQGGRKVSQSNFVCINKQAVAIVYEEEAKTH